MISPGPRYRTCLLVCAGLGAAVAAHAAELGVPLQLQVDLSLKVIEYVQEPDLHAVDVVRLGILTKPGSVPSMRFGSEMKAAIERVATIAGRPHQLSILRWTDAKALAEESKRERLAIIYLAPDLDRDVRSLARSLEGLKVITIAALDSYVDDGAILGFELISAHPKILFNREQAKKQGLAFRAAVMKLMRMVE
jgi:hypothetical protein